MYYNIIYRNIQGLGGHVLDDGREVDGRANAHAPLDTLHRGEQSEGGAVDGGSII